MRVRAALCFTALAALATPAVAEVCRYVDRDANLHYSNVGPEKGWEKLACGLPAAKAQPDTSKRLGRALAKVEIGMTIKQLEDIDRLLVSASARTELVTAAGKTVTRRYPDGQYIIMRDGRVTAIQR
jgi:hypothetical protein